MSPVRDWTAQNAAALALLLASAAVAVGVAQGEVMARLPGAAPTGASTGGADAAVVASRSVPEPDPAASSRLVLETVARNPFRSERARPAGRYRVPGSEPPAPTAPATIQGGALPAAPPRAPLPQFRLVGLAALAGGKGIAAIQVSGASPRVVNVGDSISGFRLVAVSPTEATLTGADTTLVIRSSPQAP